MIKTSEKTLFNWRHVKRHRQELNLCSRILVSGLLVFAVGIVNAGGPPPDVPWGGSVVDPTTASIGSVLPDSDGTGQSLTIDQYKPRTLINWTSFDTGADSRVQFTQKSTDVSINRVIGNLGPTQFYGTLTAAGRIFLINTNGFMFGSGAVLNVGSLLATTSDLKKLKDWDKKDLDFSGGESPVYASIINNGTITLTEEGGFGALIAPYVENNGTLTNHEQAGGVESSLIAATEFKVKGLPENQKEKEKSSGPNKPDQKPSIELKKGQPSVSDFQPGFEGAEGPFGVTQSSTGLTQAQSGFVRLTNLIYNATVNVSGELDADQLAVGDAGGAILITNDGGEGGDIFFDGANIHARGGALAKDNNPVRVAVSASGDILTPEGGDLSSFTVCAEGGASQSCLDSEHYLPEGDEVILFKEGKPGKESNAVMAQLNFQAGWDGKEKVNGYGTIDVKLDADVSAHFSDYEDGIEVLSAKKGGPKSRVYTEAQASFESGSDVLLSGDHINVSADYASNLESYGGHRPDALASLDIHAPWNVSLDYQEIGVEADANVTFGNATAVAKAAISADENSIDIQVAGDTFKVRADATNGYQVGSSDGYGGLALSSDNSSSSGYGVGVRVYRNGDAVALASLDITAGEGASISGHTQVEANALIDNLPEFEGGSDTYWGNALADADLDVLAGNVSITGDTEVSASAVHNTWETWQVGGFGGADADAEIYARGGDVTIDGDMTVAALQRGNTSWSTQDVWRPEYLYKGGDDFESALAMKHGDDDDGDQYAYGVQQGAEADLDVVGGYVTYDGALSVTAESENNAGNNWEREKSVAPLFDGDGGGGVGMARAEAMAELVADGDLLIGQNNDSSVKVAATAHSGKQDGNPHEGGWNNNHSAAASAMFLAASGTEGRGYDDQYVMHNGDMKIAADIDVSADARSQAYLGDSDNRTDLDLGPLNGAAVSTAGVVLGSAGDMELRGDNSVTSKANAYEPVFPEYQVDEKSLQQGPVSSQGDATSAAFFLAGAGDASGYYSDGEMDATLPSKVLLHEYDYLPASSLDYQGSLKVDSQATAENGNALSASLAATLSNGDLNFTGPVDVTSLAKARGFDSTALSGSVLTMLAGLNVDYIGLMGDARFGVADMGIWDAFDADDDLGPFADQGPMPMAFMGDLYEEIGGRQGILTPAALNYKGDILVESTARANSLKDYYPDERSEGPMQVVSSGSLGLAILGAGGDATIDTDPVIVNSTAESTQYQPTEGDGDFPDQYYMGGMAVSLSGLVTVAGLDSLEEMYRTDSDWDEVEKYDLNIIGNHEANAYARTGVETPDANHPMDEEPESDWDLAISLNALLASGDITVRGNDPLARSNSALAQGRETLWEGCSDNFGCTGDTGIGPFFDTPEYAQLLILAGGDVDIQPKNNFLDTITPYEQPTPVPTGSPGNLPLRFAANGDMLVATGVGVTTPPSIEAMNLDIEAALAAGGDPTTLLAPTAAGPGSQAGLRSGQDAYTTTGPDFCDKLVAGACLSGETAQ